MDMRKRGRLKIFFSYADGTGKTYAMLLAVTEQLKQGRDIVIGHMDQAMDEKTKALAEHMEKLPGCRHADAGGAYVYTFNLDAAVNRHPQGIILGRLAGRNASGCRHMYRYQDVEELLNAGIDVYTTLNVQNLESLNDIVASVLGREIGDRVPDSLFDAAENVEMIDAEPESVLEQSLKVHQDNFWNQTQHDVVLRRLAVLRELAYRRSAQRVEQQKIPGTNKASSYPADEHILVCLSSSPSNGKIIRTAARMASAFKGKFTALFVETPDASRMSQDDLQRLRAHTHLARQLGAEIETVYGVDIAFQIAEFARIAGVSKIVIGRSNTRRRLLQVGRSFAQQLTAMAPNLDIYIIPDDSVEKYRAPQYHRFGVFSFGELFKTMGVIGAATLIGMVFDMAGFREANIITVYLLGVLLVSVITNGWGYSIAASVVSVFVFNFFFASPRYTLNAYDVGYPVTFLIMFAGAFLSSSLATKFKEQAAQSARVAYRTKVLFETNHRLSQEMDARGIMKVTSEQLTKLLERNVIFYPVNDGRLGTGIFEPWDFAHPQPPDLGNDDQKAVAWALANNKHAGATTNTFSGAQFLYLTVRAASGIYGVVGIHAQAHPLEAFESSIVLSILGECGLALEKEFFERKRAEAAACAKNEQLRANLLRSISHDLRTPLTSISGNAGVLLHSSEQLSPQKRQKLYSDIYDDSIWLINLVENLLAVTKLEQGSMNLNMQTELLEEIIGEAMRHLSRDRDRHEIRVVPNDDLILVRADARLMIQVIINIIDNAIKYTQEGSVIMISTGRDGRWAYAEISDNGPGIADEAKEKIFEMFYTVSKTLADSRRSLGLGLALCRSIISAHGGTITVRDNSPCGTVFRMTLPAEETKFYE